MRKPYYKSSHKCWYFKDDSGRETRLDPDEQKAYTLWSLLNATDCLDDNSAFAVLAEAWMQEHKHCMNPTNFKRYCQFVVNFSEEYATYPCMKISKGVLFKWLASPKPGKLRRDGSRGPSITWAVATRKDAACAIRRIYSWAHSAGRISKNPLADIKVPDARPRVVLVDPVDHSKLIRWLQGREDGKQLALYLIASKCGARPIQLREVRKRNVSADCETWTFAEHKTVEHTGKPLVVQLPPCVATITKMLASVRKDNDLLFVNHKGDPWLKDTVCQRLKRIKHRIGLSENFIAYAYRHTFATNAMLAGVHVGTVAALLGHTDPRTTLKVYGHLDQDQDHLKQAAAKALGKKFES